MVRPKCVGRVGERELLVGYAEVAGVQRKLAITGVFTGTGCRAIGSTGKVVRWGECALAGVRRGAVVIYVWRPAGGDVD